MIPTRFKNLLEKSRFFETQFFKLINNNVIDKHILEIIINYFTKFIAYHNFSDEFVSNTHLQFLNEYRLHLIEFEKSGRYPYQFEDSIIKDRAYYDIPLLCSTFLTYHRYCIFEILNRKIKAKPNDKVAVVGVGCGIELEFLKDKSKNIFAYDIELGEFIQRYFSSVNFYEKHFCYEAQQSYDKIILIEILEHLENYDELLKDAMKSLDTNGRIHFTTAVNIPQFDHLRNFDLNDSELENYILKNNFEIEYKIDLPHNYSVNVDAYNCYYIIKKSKNDI